MATPTLRVLEEIQQAGEEVWESLKAGVQRVWEELSRAREEAASKF